MQPPDNLTQFQANVRAFVEKTLLPEVNKIDEAEQIDRSLIQAMANQGFLGASIKKKNGGQALPSDHLMVLHKEVARAHGSLENLVTVTGMVAAAVERFAKSNLIRDYVKALAKGELIGGFAMTEPNIGSNLSHVETTITRDGDDYVINGVKTWITLAQIADFFVVLGRTRDNHTQVILVDRSTPGLSVEPIRGMIGLRANMLGTVTFDQCRVPAHYLLGSETQGLALSATFGLHEGRFTTACGCLGLADAALEVMTERCISRQQAGKPLYRHQLVQKMLSETLVAVMSAQELVNRAAEARDMASPDMVQAIMIAKYAASQAARLASNNAVQLLGASGCHAVNHAERYFRDAKAMEIIEGTTQIHEIQIALAYIATNVERAAA